MKKNITSSILAVLFLINFTSKAQLPDWEWAIGSTGESQVQQKLVTDNNGNPVVSGQYVGIMTLGGTTVSTHANNLAGSLPFLLYDLFIAKFDVNGNLLWVVYPTGVDTNNYSQCNDIATDPFGNIYAFLNFTPRTPSAAVVFGTDTISTPTSLVKFDSNGNVVWHVDINREEQCRLATDNSGNVYLLSSFYSNELTRTYDTVTVSNPHPLGYSEAIIVKFNSDGHALWAKTAGGNNEESLVNGFTDYSGNFYVGGTFTSDTMFFDATTYLINTAPAVFSPSDYFYAKYDGNGNVLWAKSIPYASLGFTSSPSFVLTGNAGGELYLSGMQSDTSFYVGPYNFTSPGLFAAKMDVNGDPVWATYVGNPIVSFSASDIQVDGSGYTYITGFFIEDSIMMANAMLYNAGPGTGSGDNYVAMLNPTGALVGAFSEGGDDWDNQTIKVNANGSMYLALSSSSSSLAFGNTSFTNANFPSNHFYLTYTDPFVSGISNLEPGENFSVYPNPVSKEIHMQFKNHAGFNTTVSILNTLGETVYSQKAADAMNQGIDVSSLPPGVYFLQIQNSKAASSARFIKY